jgi:hypothetical protein
MQIVIIGAALVVMAVVGYFFLGTAPAEQVTQNTTPTPVVAESNTNVNQNTTANATVNVSSYKNGTFTQRGVYNSPAGSESVTVTLTLENDVVKSATFKGDATNKASINNQGKFAAGFSGVVVGKPVDSIALTVVNGSSLTPKGFMDALNKIKSEAKM